MYQAVIDSPVGKLGFYSTEDFLTGIEFADVKHPLLTPKDPICKEAAQQLQAYFKKSDFIFDLPIQLNVTEFQNGVLKVLQKIRAGETLTYSDIANKLNTHPRAIGGACRHNPIVIVIPCHRVLAKHSTGGFNGSTKGHWPRIKAWLLNHEVS